MNSKIKRINAELARQISYIINYGLKDPRVSDGMISVTKVNAAADLKTAKVYVSFLNSDSAEAFAALKSAAGFIRNELKGKLDIRYMPELTFIKDDSIEYGIRLYGLIKEVNKNDSGR